MTTWRKELENVCARGGDKFEDLAHTMTAEELDTEFDDGYGAPEGVPFTAWSEDWVYFPVVYDGLEWVGTVPRNPCNKKTAHMGNW